MGEFAAVSESCFGTLVQRVMSHPLGCRYHYGREALIPRSLSLSPVHMRMHMHIHMGYYPTSFSQSHPLP